MKFKTRLQIVLGIKTLFFGFCIVEGQPVNGAQTFYYLSRGVNSITYDILNKYNRIRPVVKVHSLSISTFIEWKSISFIDKCLFCFGMTNIYKKVKNGETFYELLFDNPVTRQKE